MIPRRLRRPRALRAGGALALCLALVPLAAQGQAWLPPKGTFSYSIDYTDILNKKHFGYPGCVLPDGTSCSGEADVGHTDNQVLSFSASYSPTDRISINASLPYVRTRHRDNDPTPDSHDTPIDDGSWHSTITDLQFTVNYQLVTGAFGLAPYVGAVIPTHDYTTFGHSAPGRGLNEYWVGAYAAMSLNEWIPRTYVQLRGNYAFVEEVLDIAHDRINAVLEIGYFPTPRWNLRAIYSQQWTEGGINVPIPVTDPRFPYHDQLVAEEFKALGGGATWVINERVSVYAFYLQHLDGTNAHKVDHRVSTGVSYGLGGHH
ncbi:MAG TPA: hypothetical protein VJL86_13150 [Steroidobacteraceae bacterium]|nr:hypothetical protein [Steroidobacteraceae bacterium]